MATRDKDKKTRRGRVRPRESDRDLSTEEGSEETQRKRSSASATQGSERPGGILTRGPAWERAHLARMKNRDNVYSVRATTFGYYNHRLFREGEEFRMAIDPKLEPPRWVVIIKGPRGKVLGLPKKGGGIEKMDVLPNEFSQEMPLDGRGMAAKRRQEQLEQELEDEEEEEEKTSRKRRRRVRAAEAGEEDEEEE